jgi:hypothetical protein
MSVEPSILSPEFTTYDAVVPFVPWHGPICIGPRGFKQHYGECWNDATQMLLLSTDGMRERFQRLLFEGAINRTLIEQTLRRMVADAPARLTDYMYEYMVLMQRRFKRHYAGQILGRTFGSKSGRNAIPCAAYGRHVTYELAGKTQPYIEAMTVNSYKEHYLGGMPALILNLLAHIYELMPLPIIELVRSHGIFSYFRDMRNVGGVLIKSTTHAYCMYRCNKVEYYYDNNYGSVSFPMRKYFDERSYPLVERDFNESNRLVMVDLSIDGTRRFWPAVNILKTFYIFDPADGQRVRLPATSEMQTVNGRTWQLFQMQLVESVVPIVVPASYMGGSRGRRRQTKRQSKT